MPAPHRLARAAWHLVQYASLRLAAAFLVSIPPDAAEEAARGIGRIYYRIDGPRRRTTNENLRIAFGDRLDEAARERLAVKTFEHAFVLATEVAWRRRILPNVRAFRRRRVILGDEAAMRDDLRAGRGGIVMTAHLGNWEIAGAYLRYERVPFAAVARPIDNPIVDRYLTRLRGGAANLIEKHGAVKDVSEAVSKGTWVGILADQNAGRRGLFVPFFGVPASSFRFGATLALRHDFPVYFAVALRRGKGFRYEFHVRRYVPPPGLDRKDGERLLLEAYFAQLEAWIREVPEQYFWLHRRWRTRPDGEERDEETPVYDRRGAPREG